MDIIHSLYNLLMVLFLYDLLVSIDGMKDREKKKRRRCPRVCLRELSKEYSKLKEEIDRLKLLREKGDPGERGLQGLKGDPGSLGPPGLPGPKGETGDTPEPLPFVLPHCESDELITSNGQRLTCVKVDFRSSSSKDYTDARQPFPPAVTNPTISPEARKKMTIFEKKNMIQSIHGDTWDVGVVRHDADFYFFSSYLKREFAVYKWLSDVFFLLRTFPMRHARSWDTFVMDGYLYIAVACSTDSQSAILKVKQSDRVEKYQQIAVKSVFGVKPVFVGAKLYLVYTSIHGPSSSIYIWDEEHKIFVQHQTVNAYGSGLETFKIDDKVFLAFTARVDGPVVSLYYSRGGQDFKEYSVIRGIRDGYSLHHMEIANDHFLAVAKFNNNPSLILRWDGRTFRTHQTMPTLRARGFASITSSLMGRGKIETYLAVANSQSNPGIYFFDAGSKMFVKLQEMEATLTRDVDFFAMGNHIYFVVSATKVTNIYRGMIGQPS